MLSAQLQHLSFRNVSLESRSLCCFSQALAEALISNTSVKNINLVNNGIVVEGAEAGVYWISSLLMFLFTVCQDGV